MVESSERKFTVESTRRILDCPQKKWFAQRSWKIANYNLADTTKLNRIYTDLLSKNKDVIQMWMSQSSFDTPDPVIKAVKQALDQGITRYEDLPGWTGLQEAIAEKMRTYNNMDVVPDQIIVTVGEMGANFLVTMCFLEKGDEVLVLDPGYFDNFLGTRLAEAVPVPVPLREEEGYKVIREDWESRITPKTRAIYLINPNNPGGRVFTRKELSILADLAVENDLIVSSDEVYEYLVYDENKHISIATLPGMAERTFTCNSFSKAYAMTGWKIGYLVAPSVECAKNMRHVLRASIGSYNAFVQRGAAKAIQCVDHLKKMITEYTRRRELVYKRLNEMEDVYCYKPEGGSNCFPNFSKYATDDVRFCEFMLDEAHVFFWPGSYWGRQGKGHVRAVFVQEPCERLEIAMDRVETALKKLKKP